MNLVKIPLKSFNNIPKAHPIAMPPALIIIIRRIIVISLNYFLFHVKKILSTFLRYKNSDNFAMLTSVFPAPLF